MTDCRKISVKLTLHTLAFLVCGGVTCSPQVARANSNDWHVVSFEKKDVGIELPLPPLATVTENDASGKTWQQTGESSGTLATIRGEFAQALQGDGWKLDKTIFLGQLANRSELAIWTKSGHRILLLVWEKEAGICGFSWGKER